MLDPLEQARREPAQRRSRDQAADGAEQKGRRDAGEREAIRPGGLHGDAEDQECGRIIEETFALEDSEHAMRWVDAPQHGGCGNGIRWRDDGTECDRGRPREGGNERPRDQRNSCGRQGEGEDDQAEDGRAIVAEVAERGVVGGVQQHGRDEQGEGQLGR